MGITLSVDAAFDDDSFKYVVGYVMEDNKGPVKPPGSVLAAAGLVACARQSHNNISVQSDC